MKLKKLLDNLKLTFFYEQINRYNLKKNPGKMQSKIAPFTLDTLVS